MSKLLIATHNKGKLMDFKNLLESFGFELISLADANIDQEADENADTFEENSYNKAKFYAHLSGVLTLADDGGLEIAALDNKPGVHTRRWESETPLTDKELIDKILDKMKDLKKDERQAVLRTVITVYDPETSNHVQTEGVINGSIVDALDLDIIEGYPVRSLFYIPQIAKVYGELSLTEKDSVNHRKMALEKIKSELIKFK